MQKIWFYKFLFFFLEDCVWGPWSTWLSCSKPCGSGSSNRSRTKTKIEQIGGTCSGSGSDSKQCNTQSCPGNFSKIQHLLSSKGLYWCEMIFFKLPSFLLFAGACREYRTVSPLLLIHLINGTFLQWENIPSLMKCAQTNIQPFLFC